VLKKLTFNNYDKTICKQWWCSEEKEETATRVGKNYPLVAKIYFFFNLEAKLKF